MGRLTIALPDELHQALREAAARQGRSIGAVVAESLTAYGVKPRAAAESLLRKARERSGLGEQEALRLAVRETRAVRRMR